MEHRDSPEVEPELGDEGRSRPGRRFARLVGSPVSRRVAFRRLLAASGLLLGLSALAWVVVTKILQGLARWVDQRPEHQIKFAEIELVPPPDPWIDGGASEILAEVQKGSGLGESIPLLDLDLEALVKDFRRCGWVKDVHRVDRTNYRRLTVHLAYRKPVAIVEDERVSRRPFVLDEEAVVLDGGAIRWTINSDPYHVLGMASPLIKIKRLPASTSPPKIGLPLKWIAEGGSSEVPDPLVQKAATLARFLQERRLTLKSPREAPDFVSIFLPDVRRPNDPFFLLDSGQNWVCWGRAPGDEKPGKPSADARWRMLLDWIAANGPLVAKYPNYLYFTDTEAKLHEPGRSGNKKQGS
jgi:hypothetical protein